MQIKLKTIINCFFLNICIVLFPYPAFQYNKIVKELSSPPFTKNRILSTGITPKTPYVPFFLLISD